jgi:hypothetical protein
MWLSNVISPLLLLGGVKKGAAGIFQQLQGCTIQLLDPYQHGGQIGRVHLLRFGIHEDTSSSQLIPCQLAR